MNRLYYVLFFLFLMTSCDSSRIYEDNYDFPGNDWPLAEEPTFDFSIEDTSQVYNLGFNVRNAFNYPYYNLYYKYELLDSTNRILMSELKEIYLFDAKTGEPFGDGLGDLFDHRQVLLTDYKFPFNGQFSLRFTQYMRQDTLPMILSVGARVEVNSN